MSSKITAFGLRSKKIIELRDLAQRFLGLSPQEAEILDRQNLITQLSQAIEEGSPLSAELEALAVSIKPSFYLMVVAPQTQSLPSSDGISERLDQALIALNSRLRSVSGAPHYKGFTLEQVEERDQNNTEI